jgi:hypothetical protein
MAIGNAPEGHPERIRVLESRASYNRQRLHCSRYLNRTSLEKHRLQAKTKGAGYWKIVMLYVALARFGGELESVTVITPARIPSATGSER